MKIFKTPIVLFIAASLLLLPEANATLNGKSSTVPNPNQFNNKAVKLTKPGVDPRQAKDELKYVPGELIVKVRANGNANPKQMFAEGKAIKYSAGKGKRKKQNQTKIKGMRKLYKEYEENPKRKGKSYKTAAEQANEVSKRFSKRQKRAKRNAGQNLVVPDLENIYVIKVDPKADIEALAQEYKKANPNTVVYAQPNYLAKGLLTPNDPSFNQQWSHKKTEAEVGWNITTGNGSEETVIAIIDTGVDYTHPDLAANIWQNKGKLPGKPEIANNGIDDDENGFIDDYNGADFVAINPENWFYEGMTFSEGEDYTNEGVLTTDSFNRQGLDGDSIINKLLELGFINEQGQITADARDETINGEFFRAYFPDYEDKQLTLIAMIMFQALYDNDPIDFNGHGTHCAGIAAAKGNNGVGVSGTCPDCKIMPVRAGFEISQYGQTFTLFEYSASSAAIKYAVDNGADVISMSFGGPSFDQGLKAEAIEYAKAMGVVLVAGAGNTSTSEMFYPAGFDGVISVAATNEDDQRAYFSTYGTWVSVAAPGTNIISTVPTLGGGQHVDSSGYKLLNGTSMSTPYVAGLAGLILSKHPEWNPDQVKSVIVHTADGLPDADQYVGAGRVNVRRALELATPPPTATDVYLDLYSPNYDSGVIENTIDILGSAQGITYTLSYGKGIYPTESEWNDFKSGTANLFNESLGQLDLQGKPEGLYSIRLRVFDSAGNYKDTRTVIFFYKFNGDAPDFPVKIYDAFYSDVVVEDLNSDGKKEILVPAFELHTIKTNGEEFFPDPLNYAEANPVLVGDLEGDGEKEIITSNSTYYGLTPGVFAYTKTGELLWENHLVDTDKSYGAWLGALADLNQDSSLEIIAAANPTGNVRTVYILNKDGQTLVSKEFDNIDQIASVAVGNIMGDANKEIVLWNAPDYPYSYTFPAAFHITDSQLKLLYSSAVDPTKENAQNNATSAPILVDLTGDGKPEVAYGVLFISSTFQSLSLAIDYIEFKDAKFETKRLKAFPITDGPQYYFMPKLLAGDINNDGKTDLIMSVSSTINKSKVFALDLVSGKELFNITIPQRDVEATGIGDLDGDGYPDVVVTTKKSVFAYNYNGNLLKDFPIRVEEYKNYSSLQTSAIADFFNDGKVAIAVPNSSYIHLLPMTGDYHPETMHWTMFGHDPQHTWNYTPPFSTKPSGSIKIYNPSQYSSSSGYVNTRAVNLALTLKYMGSTQSTGRVQFSNDKMTWSPVQTFSSTKPWTLSAGDGDKTVYVKFGACATSACPANTIIWSNPYSLKTTLDTSLPTGSITIKPSTSQSLSLTLSATDTGSGMGNGAQMQFSNDGVNWSPFQAYSTSASWYTTGGYGLKTVFVKFKDVAGNVSTPYSASITTVDKTSPQGSIRIIASSNTVTSRSINLALTAYDAESGMGAGAQMQFSNDNIVWQLPVAYSTTKTYTLPAGNGLKTVYVKFQDVAGNLSTAYSASITLNETVVPPTDDLVTLCYRCRTIKVPVALKERYVLKGATEGACTGAEVCSP